MIYYLSCLAKRPQNSRSGGVAQLGARRATLHTPQIFVADIVADAAGRAGRAVPLRHRGFDPPILFLFFFSIFLKKPVRSGPGLITKQKTEYGGVAQLGERRVRNAEVMGSNPTISTDIQAGA